MSIMYIVLNTSYIDINWGSHKKCHEGNLLFKYDLVRAENIKILQEEIH